MLSRVSAPWVSALWALVPRRVWSPPPPTIGDKPLTLKECDGWTLGEDTVLSLLGLPLRFCGVFVDTVNLGFWDRDHKDPWESPTTLDSAFQGSSQTPWLQSPEVPCVGWGLLCLGT